MKNFDSNVESLRLIWKTKSIELNRNYENKLNFDFRVESNSNTHMFFLDAGNDAIGINESSPQNPLHITTSDFKALQLEGPRPTAFFKETDGSADENFQLRVNGGDFLISRQTDAQDNAVDVLTLKQSGDVEIDNGNLVLASGHGIDFSATANAGNGTMQNELLNDYEEGTFTPTFTTNSGSAASAATVLGRYTKIGRMVYVTVHLTDIDTTGTTSSSSFRVDGLPFTVDQAGMSAPLVTHGFTFEGGRTYAVGFFSASEFVSFLQMGSGFSDTNIDHSHIADDTADIICAGFYFTDQ